MGDDTKLNVTISCQSRSTSARLTALRERVPSGSGSMCSTCARADGGDVVVAVDARDFLDEVFLDREIEAARRRRHDEVVALRA